MERTITVKGTGSASAKPDYIIISMTVESVDPDYDRSMAGTASRVAALSKAAVGAGCEKGDMKTASFHAETRYENVRDSQGGYTRKFIGYACVYHLKLSFDFDSKQLARVLSAIAESHAEPEVSIAFTVKEPERIGEALLIDAAKNARAKAEILCKASGSTLGELMHIDYHWDEPDLVSRTSYQVENAVQPLMAASRCAAPEMEPEDIRLHDRVTFVWSLL